jgi:hypothetical protein
MYYAARMDHKSIIKMFGAPQLAEAIGQKKETVRKWQTRGKIPAAHWPAIVKAGQARDMGITYRGLAESQEAA